MWHAVIHKTIPNCHNISNNELWHCGKLVDVPTIHTHYAFVEVPLDGDKHIAKGGAEIGGRVHILCSPHMVAHLHQHVERVEAVDLVAQCYKTVQLGLDALKDLIHHLPDHVFPGRDERRVKNSKRLIRPRDANT